ncbi:helix-turn-helix domain-containing protein [Nocardia sp. NPDC050710]|uniref:helix-turn-helix domain-containing protein n=1 Tax=Nocardia sp. NPDC050710 TaxID=3157220 RepID=UPI0033EE5078
MPSLGRFLRQIRESLHNPRTRRALSREKAAQRVGLSTAYLIQIEKDLRVPTPQALQLLTAGYGLTAAQARHIRELREPPVPVLSGDIVRARIRQSPAVLDRLTRLDHAQVIAAYFDPFWNLLAANHTMHDTFPALAEAGNLLLWHFSTDARERLPDWELETAQMVALLKPTLGVHRRAADARQLLTRLQHDYDFQRMWTRSCEITYHRDPTTPLRIRTVTDHLRAINVEASTVSDVHGYVRLYQGLSLPEGAMGR